MQKTFFFRNIFYIFCGIFCTTICYGIDLSSTQILKINGNVEVKKTDSTSFKKLRKNLKLSGSLKRLDGGDKVKTHQSSNAEMALKNTCILAVKEQSLFEVPKLNEVENVTQLKAQQGSILFKVISGNNFEVRTADVIAGVKGTLFEMDVLDGFYCLAGTPGLEIGTLAAGGTIVNVFKGEVELKHAITGKTRTLKAGEGISVFNNQLLNVDTIVQDGFGILQKFNPVNLVEKKFGEAGSSLLTANPSLDGLMGLADETSFPAAISDKKSRFNSMFTGFSAPVVEKLNKAEAITRQTGQVIGEVRELETIGRDLVGEKFKADFSSFRVQKNPFFASEKGVKEVYLDNYTFASAIAGFGSDRLKMEPTKEGLSLLEGFGSMRVKKFHGSNSAIEFLLSYYESAENLVTNIKVLKGNLYARIPGEIDVFKIPAGESSFTFNLKSGKYGWGSPSQPPFAKQIVSYNFQAEKKLSKQKQSHDSKTTKKRVNSIKKIIKKNPRNLLRGLGF